MNTYLRVLRLVRPYLTFILLSMFFMVVFSLLSGFSIVMIAPFLEALFTPETADIAVTGAAGSHAIVVPDTLGVADAVTRADDLQRSFSVTGLRDDLMARLKAWLHRDTKMETLWVIVLVFFILNLVKNLSGYLQTVCTDYVQHSFIRDLRNRLFEKFTSLPLSFYHNHRAGELISRATNDVLVVNRSVNVSFTNLARDPVMIVMYLAMALLLSWRLTLLAMLVLPLSMLIIVRIGKKLRKYSHRQQEKMANITTRLQETISGIRVVKAFTSEGRENARFRAESQRLFKDLFKIARMQRLSSPLTEQLSVLVGLFVLWYGGRQVLGGGELPPHLFILFLFFVFSLGRPIKELSQVNNAIQEGLAAAERVFAVLDHPVEILENARAAALTDVRGDIELRGVRFSYRDGAPVLKGVDLKVEPGEVVALVGASGAGKSTLVDLIPRFYDPTEGQVLLDGHDLRDLTLASLRGAVGLVTQEVILFNDTVRNNIAYGLPDVGIDEMVAAARAANAHDFIVAMPDGYDTLIGDRGLKLSGGQRQRLSIARAILKNPPVLILDEATSALDTESEKLVQEAIDRLVRDRTTIVIAHRLSTIQHVDRIYVMQAGRIVQIGDHEALLADTAGPYRTLHDLQFRT
ncbi:ABC transporter ATP-binding protein/permease [bacterium]|nr:ABC transporter ATP-binding protein/permease [bacterium]MBU1074188.1 ABC transporter ATP-binding protein/permease [bacterium]